LWFKIINIPYNKGEEQWNGYSAHGWKFDIWHFCWSFGHFTPPALTLVFYHLSCCLAFVFCHVSCWLATPSLLLPRAFVFKLYRSCRCAPLLCYVVSLFCFFFIFLLCTSLLILHFCSVGSLLASLLSSFFIYVSSFFAFSLLTSSTQGVILWLFTLVERLCSCFVLLSYISFFRLFGVWLHGFLLLPNFSIFFFRLFSFVFQFLLLHACVHVLLFLPICFYFVYLVFYYVFFGFFLLSYFIWGLFHLFCNLLCYDVPFSCEDSI